MSGPTSISELLSHDKAQPGHPAGEPPNTMLSKHTGCASHAILWLSGHRPTNGCSSCRSRNARCSAACARIGLWHDGQWRGDPPQFAQLTFLTLLNYTAASDP